MFSVLNWILHTFKIIRTKQLLSTSKLRGNNLSSTSKLRGKQSQFNSLKLRGNNLSPTSKLRGKQSQFNSLKYFKPNCYNSYVGLGLYPKHDSSNNDNCFKL